MKTRLFFFCFFTLLVYTFMSSAQVNYDLNLQSKLMLEKSNNQQFTADNPPLTTGSWVTLGSTPHAVSRSCTAFLKRNDTGYVYQFGGGTGVQYVNVARYNTRTSVWTNNVSTMPFNMSSATAIPYGDSVIFIFGGEISTGLGKCIKWNVNTNTWTVMAQMNINPATDQLSVKYKDTLVFCIGGGDGAFSVNVFSDVRIYNLKRNTWSTSVSLPIAKAMMGGGIYGDTLIVGSGWTSGLLSTAVVHKGVITGGNPSSITWSTIADYPAGAVLRPASGTIIKGLAGGVCITGGAIDGAALTSATYMWNFCTQTWQSLPNNSLARSNYKGGAADSSLWCPGGFTTVGVGQFDRITFQLIDGSCGLVGITVNENGVPSGYVLAQNYPNPFNPTTTFTFGLPSTGLTKLVVTDVLGREVAVLVNEQKTAGIHSVNFDASRLSSGIYFYTLSSGSFKETKKMLLVK